MTDSGLALDKDGYLVHLEDWSRDVAQVLADGHHIQLAAEHWEVLDCLRQFYADTQVSPAMRPFVKLVKSSLGEDKGNSIYLMQLFGHDGQSPAKIAAKLAGLPRPTNCL